MKSLAELDKVTGSFVSTYNGTGDLRNLDDGQANRTESKYDIYGRKSDRFVVFRTNLDQSMKTLWFRLFLIITIGLKCINLQVDAFETKRITPNQKTFVVSFDDGDAKILLARSGITNRFIEQIERDSQGDALAIYFSRFDSNVGRSALIVNQHGCMMKKFSNATGPVGLRDDLSMAYSLDGGFYTCVNNQTLPVNGQTNTNLWLQVLGAPGNEILALGFPVDPDRRIVYASNPTNVIFQVNSIADIPVHKIFYKSGTLFVFGVLGKAKGTPHWECWAYRSCAARSWQVDERVIIPDAIQVLDLDPDSPNVLFYKWGLMGKKAFLFNLETKKTSATGIGIFRESGYIVREVVVLKLREALKTRQIIEQLP